MSTETQAADPSPEDFTRSWRYKVGLFMIIAGNGVIVLGLFLPALGFGADIVGAAVIGGEVVSLGSIAFLGKEGFKAIKAKFFAFIGSGFAAEVGPTRHYIGITLLCTNILTTAVIAAFAWTVFEVTTPEQPLPDIWGLNFAQQGDLMFWLLLTGELSFLIAIYLLGAEWWGRFRGLFVWKGERPT